jgi:arylsulfatase A-like enzyme
LRLAATALSCVLLLCLCTPLAGAQQPNVLFVIADDLGVDNVGAYGEAADAARTPVIDGLAQQGVLFRNCWSNTACSPTRATLLTGRYCRRTGFGWGTDYATAATELPLSEISIAEALPAAYRKAAVGKWHMGSQHISGALHPNLQGFEHFRGILSVIPGAFGNGYFDWEKVTNGVFSWSTKYVTTEQVDDALELIASFGNDPWFMWLGFFAPHSPFHKPPANLHTYTLPASVNANVPIHYKAAAEAMDKELGRLLASMDPAVRANTIIIFVGDNGTPAQASTPPFLPAHAKLSPYEGGINVPLIISGPGVVQGAQCGALVNTTDFFATIAQLAGAGPVTAEDSISLVPYLSAPAQPSIRSHAYAEMFRPNGPGPYTERQRCVRNGRYKLIEVYTQSSGPQRVELYDLQLDPFEQANLLTAPLSPPAQAAYAELAAVIFEPYVAWLTTGVGLPGTAGTPLLAGSGNLVAGSNFALTLSQARPNATTMLILGWQNLGLWLKGGMLVPSPDFVYTLNSGPAGTIALNGTWPAGIPAGTAFVFQDWVADPAAVAGWASSNGLAAIAP